MSGLLVGFQVSCQISAARECRSHEFLHHANLTKHGIADLGGFCGKIRLVQCAAQQRSGRHLKVLRTSGLRYSEEEKWNYEEKLAAPHDLPPEGGSDSGPHSVSWQGGQRELPGPLQPLRRLYSLLLRHARACTRSTRSAALPLSYLGVIYFRSHWRLVSAILAEVSVFVLTSP